MATPTPPPSPAPPRVRVPLLAGRGGLVSWVVRIAVVLAVPLVAYNANTTYIAPWEFAVRQVYVGPGQGIQDNVYGPGVHLVIPGYEKLHVFPRNLQVLEFNDDQLQASAEASYAPSLHVQTSEGYRVTVDVSVLYRISDPYKVVTSVGPGSAYETALVRPRAETALRQTLGQLDAEQFYEGSLRRQKSWEARDLLTKELEPDGIQVWAVLVRHYTYDDRYQEAIENRKIQDQTVFKNRAEAIAAQEEAEKNRVLAAGQAIVDVEKQRGDTEVQKIKAEADLYAKKKNADGDLQVQLAEAEAKRLENDALSAAGASNVVGLQMAEALKNTKVIIVPTEGAHAVDPLNLDQLIQGW